MPLTPPAVIRPTSIMVTPFSYEGTCGFQFRMLAVTSGASIAWGTANLAQFYPIQLQESATFVKVFWMNGATASGNVDVGLYTLGGSRLFSCGTTAQGTINVVQEVDITNFTVGPGQYYLAIAFSSATATVFAGAPAIGAKLAAAGAAQMASAFVLPATATLALNTQVVGPPYFGLSRRTLVA